MVNVTLGNILIALLRFEAHKTNIETERERERGIRNDLFSTVRFQLGWKRKFRGSENFVEVYDVREEAMHFFGRTIGNPTIKSAELIYWDDDFCKTIAKFDLDGLNPDDRIF